jgi:hypothetical protein
LTGMHVFFLSCGTALFCEGFFQDRVLWTICPAGFEPWSSWSLPPE